LDRRRIRYIQPSAGQYVKDRTSFETASFDLFAAFQSGVFGEVNITRYPLADAQRAHEDIGARRNAGSIILIPEYA
jgi:NADPH2:quinone reductase